MKHENRECISTASKSSLNRVCSKLELKNRFIKIGQGGFGDVYSITAIINGKKTKLVLKVIEKKMDDSLLKDFYYEVEYSEKMGILGIGPKVYDAFYYITDGRIFQNIIMERFDMSVSDWIHSNIFPRGSGFIVKHMLNLLKKQIFKIGIFCSDIKPQNYVIKFNGNSPTSVKMIDFGIDWCGSNIPNIYITSPSLRLYDKNIHKEIFYSLCLVQLFMFILRSFEDTESSLNVLAHFYTDKLFINYIINRGRIRGVNIKLIFYDVLETDKEQAQIMKHYLGKYGNDNESIVNNIFSKIDEVTSLLF